MSAVSNPTVTVKNSRVTCERVEVGLSYNGQHTLYKIIGHETHGYRRVAFYATPEDLRSMDLVEWVAKQVSPVAAVEVTNA